MKEEFFKTTDESNLAGRPSYSSKKNPQEEKLQVSPTKANRNVKTCASERTSTKQENESISKVKSKQEAPKLQLQYSSTTSDLKTATSKQVKQQVSTSCNTSIMDYIKSAKNHWALQHSQVARLGLAQKNQTHMAHLDQELKKTHKKLNSICLKETSELLETMLPLKPDHKKPGNIDELHNQTSIDQNRNNFRTISRGSCSPKAAVKRNNILGSRKVSLPIQNQTCLQRDRMVRPTIKKQLEFSPDSDKKESSQKKGRVFSLVEPTLPKNEILEKTNLQVFIKTKLTGFYMPSKPVTAIKTFNSATVRNSLDQRKDTNVSKPSNNFELARQSVMKAQSPYSKFSDLQRKPPKGKDTNNESIEDRKAVPRTYQKLVHQATSESLVSNTLGNTGVGSSQPKERPVVFGHQLNNKFKMIDYLEHDEKLVSTKKEYRVGLFKPGKTERIQKSNQCRAPAKSLRTNHKRVHGPREAERIYIWPRSR